MLQPRITKKGHIWAEDYAMSLGLSLFDAAWVNGLAWGRTRQGQGLVLYPMLSIGPRVEDVGFGIRS